MKERKTRLIESGMKLFAEKGYHNTSVQEIVSEAGISKGAFYTYFKSKEDFIASSFYYFHLRLSEKLLHIMEKDYDPKESLAKQISLVTEYIDQHKNFIIMHLREDISIGENVEATFRQIRLKNYEWMSTNIKAIYGEKVTDYLTDSIIQMEGLMNGYFQWIVLEHIKVDQQRIGTFLVERLDNIVEGMITANKGSIILSDSIVNDEEYINKHKSKHKQIEIIYTMKTKVDKLSLSTKEKQRLNKVIEKIEDHLNNESVELITIQGLLAHFKGIVELNPECEQIAGSLGIDLL